MLGRVIPLTDEVDGRVERLELPWNRHGFDPYGISKRELKKFYRIFAFAYRHYFTVQNHGLAVMPARGRAMLVGNHSGGVALDAMIVLTAMFLELEPPRLAQSMTEKFISMVPFASEWSSRCGQFTGIPEHAIRLLEDERLLLVFPEGARGTAKLYDERHSLVDFGTGFMRLALATRSPIIPFAFVGGGEAIPTIFNSYRLGKLLGAPYIPITPYLFPIPLPVALDVHYGAPLVFEGTGSEDDDVVVNYVEQVKSTIAGLVTSGLRMRGGLVPPPENRR